MCTDIEDVKYISKDLKERFFNKKCPMNSSPGNVIIIIQSNGKTKTISEFDVTSNRILCQVNAYLKGIVLGTWNGELIIFHLNPVKVRQF